MLERKAKFANNQPIWQIQMSMNDCNQGRHLRGLGGVAPKEKKKKEKKKEKKEKKKQRKKKKKRKKEGNYE